MPTVNDPYQAEPDDHLCTEPLEDESGETYRVCQEAVGAERVVGSGEFPDPATPARSPAPGSVENGDQGDRPGRRARDGDTSEEGHPWPS